MTSFSLRRSRFYFVCRSTMNLPLPRLVATMREAEDVEGLGLTLSTASPILGREASELDDARFLRVQFQAELGETLAQLRLEPLDIRPIQEPNHELEFSGNLLWNDAGLPEQGMWEIGYLYSTVSIHHNTVIRVAIQWDVFTGPPGSLEKPITCHNNIFCESRIRLSSGRGGVVTCNDAWPDTIQTTPFEEDVFEDNISADPLFCGPEVGDFHVARQSPCAEENSPEGCGLIGLLLPNCDATRLEETTWGRLKLRLQEDGKKSANRTTEVTGSPAPCAGPADGGIGSPVAPAQALSRDQVAGRSFPARGS